MSVQTESLEVGRHTTALVRGCAVEQSMEAGITVFDANTTIQSTWVHDTVPRVVDNRHGFGIQVYGTPGIATQSFLVGSLVEQSVEAGVSVVSTTVSIDASTIAGTRSNNGFIGDGIAIVALDAPAVATVRKTSVLSPERSGISCFGRTAAIAGVHIDCAAIGSSADVYHDSAPRFVDEGGNTCGCGPDTGTCKVLTPNLQPPEALPH